MSKISSGEPYSIAEVWEYISVYVSVCLHTHTHTHTHTYICFALGTNEAK